MSIDIGDDGIARRLDAISDLSKNSRTLLWTLNLVCALVLFSISGATFSDKLIDLGASLENNFDVLVSTKDFDQVVSVSDLPGWDWIRKKLQNFNPRRDSEYLVPIILENEKYSADLVQAAEKLQESWSNYISEINASGTSVVRFKTPFFDQGVSYIYFVLLGFLVVTAAQAYLILHIVEYLKRISALRVVFDDDSVLEHVIYPWSLSFAIFGSTSKKWIFLLATVALPFATQCALSSSFMALYGGAGFGEMTIILWIVAFCCILAPSASLALALLLTKQLGFKVVARRIVLVFLSTLITVFIAYSLFLAFTL